jgi:16S rRNA (guanine527-N7)-methyltransferase
VDRRVEERSGSRALHEDIAAFERGADRLGLRLQPRQRQQFLDYRQLLLTWNERVNLVSRRQASMVLSRHALTSLFALPFVEPAAHGWTADLGSGGGFPGIPLKICLPDMGLVLVDSSRKKTLFLRHVVQTLNLSGTEVLNRRAETLAEDHLHRSRYSRVTVRAVAHLKGLLPVALPLLCSGGQLIAFKGRNAEREVLECSALLEEWGGRLLGVEKRRGIAPASPTLLVIIGRE